MKGNSTGVLLLKISSLLMESTIPSVKTGTTENKMCVSNKRLLHFRKCMQFFWNLTLKVFWSYFFPHSGIAIINYWDTLLEADSLMSE